MSKCNGFCLLSRNFYIGIFVSIVGTCSSRGILLGVVVVFAANFYRAGCQGKANELAEYISDKYSIDVEIYNGGQPVYSYLLSVE